MPSKGMNIFPCLPITEDVFLQNQSIKTRKGGPSFKFAIFKKLL